jgi:hypothetical protein
MPVIGCYRVLSGVIGCYRVLSGVIGCYREQAYWHVDERLVTPVKPVPKTRSHGADTFT